MLKGSIVENQGYLKLNFFVFWSITRELFKAHPKKVKQKVYKKESNIVNSRMVMKYKDSEQEGVLLQEWYDVKNILSVY